MSDPARLTNRPLRSAKVGQMFEAMGGAPSLPGAACVGEHDLFDATAHRTAGYIRDEFGGRNLDWNIDTEQARDIAKSICAGCPVISDCEAWIKSLRPEDRPSGITAGKMYFRRAPRERKAVSLSEDRAEWQENVIDLINRLS